MGSNDASLRLVRAQEGQQELREGSLKTRSAAGAHEAQQELTNGSNDASLGLVRAHQAQPELRDGCRASRSAPTASDHAATPR